MQLLWCVSWCSDPVLQDGLGHTQAGVRPPQAAAAPATPAPAPSAAHNWDKEQKELGWKLEENPEENYMFNHTVTFSRFEKHCGWKLATVALMATIMPLDVKADRLSMQVTH